MKQYRKHSFLLLEVMICFTLVILCLPPLVNSQVGMYQETEKLLAEMELEIWVQNHFVYLKEQLHTAGLDLPNLADLGKEEQIVLNPKDEPLLYPHNIIWPYSHATCSITRVLKKTGIETEQEKRSYPIFQLEISYKFTSKFKDLPDRSFSFMLSGVFVEAEAGEEKANEAT